MRLVARWHLAAGEDIGAEGDPYQDRLRLLQTPLGGIFLHHFHRPDIERDPHDHGWSFMSIVISGWYEETVWPDKRDPDRWYRREHRRWYPHVLTRRSAHKVTGLYGSLWTLCFVGPKTGDWGFWSNGQFIHHRDYPYRKPLLK